MEKHGLCLGRSAMLEGLKVGAVKIYNKIPHKTTKEELNQFYSTYNVIADVEKGEKLCNSVWQSTILEPIITSSDGQILQTLLDLGFTEEEVVFKS